MFKTPGDSEVGMFIDINNAQIVEYQAYIDNHHKQ